MYARACVFVHILCVRTCAHARNPFATLNLKLHVVIYIPRLSTPLLVKHYQEQFDYIILCESGSNPMENETSLSGKLVVKI